MQTEIPCTWMRGGSSKAAIFQGSHLPTDRPIRDRVLLACLGSPHLRQIDGIGGGDSLSSKVAIVSKCQRPDADIDYEFAQVVVDRPLVDNSTSCGNILAAVGPYAIERGLVRGQDPITVVRIFDVNTESIVEAVVQTPQGRPRYDGSAVLDGVPGTAAPIWLHYTQVAGAITGALLPTGSIRDVFEGVEVTCIDAAVPVVVVAASSVDKHGGETPAELNADVDLLARLESVRRAAGWQMGLGDVKDKVIPKLALVSSPAGTGSIRSRYFVPHKAHAAHAVTGAICVAACAMLRDSVAGDLARVSRLPQERIVIEHPSGTLPIDLETEGAGARLLVKRASLMRTARPLFEGKVLIPSSVWRGGSRTS